MTTIRGLIESNAHARFNVDFWLKDFIRTGNPFSAMQAYRLSRNFGLQIPSEVLSYFDGVTEGILKLADDPPPAKERPFAAAEVLGVYGGKRGKGSFWTQHKNRKAKPAEELRIALEAKKWIDFFGEGKEQYAFEKVVEKEGKSPATIRRIYRKVSKHW